MEVTGQIAAGIREEHRFKTVNGVEYFEDGGARVHGEVDLGGHSGKRKSRSGNWAESFLQRGKTVGDLLQARFGFVEHRGCLARSLHRRSQRSLRRRQSLHFVRERTRISLKLAPAFSEEGEDGNALDLEDLVKALQLHASRRREKNDGERERGMQDTNGTLEIIRDCAASIVYGGQSQI